MDRMDSEQSIWSATNYDIYKHDCLFSQFLKNYDKDFSRQHSENGSSANDKIWGEQDVWPAVSHNCDNYGKNSSQHEKDDYERKYPVIKKEPEDTKLGIRSLVDQNKKSFQDDVWDSTSLNTYFLQQLENNNQLIKKEPQDTKLGIRTLVDQNKKSFQHVLDRSSLNSYFLPPLERKDRVMKVEPQDTKLGIRSFVDQNKKSLQDDVWDNTSLNSYFLQQQEKNNQLIKKEPQDTKLGIRTFVDQNKKLLQDDVLDNTSLNSYFLQQLEKSNQAIKKEPQDTKLGIRTFGDRNKKLLQDDVLDNTSLNKKSNQAIKKEPQDTKLGIRNFGDRNKKSLQDDVLDSTSLNSFFLQQLDKENRMKYTRTFSRGTLKSDAFKRELPEIKKPEVSQNWTFSNGDVKKSDNFSKPFIRFWPKQKVTNASCNFQNQNNFIPIPFANKIRRPLRNDICSFCKKNSEPISKFSTHQLKTSTGIITCPVLRKHVCPICGASGDNAHTLRYCPINKILSQRK